MYQEQLLEEIKRRLIKLNEELDDARERLSGLERDVAWIKRLVLLIFGAILSILVKIFLP
jgi:hypothetical protein